MFTSLHALAKQAPIMISITAEGDELLRVNVMQVPAGSSKATLLQPLSLCAPPGEFDTDFVAAIQAWHMPKRSLVEQAQAASEAGQAKAPASKTSTPKADRPETQRAARKKKANETDAEPTGLPAASDSPSAPEPGAEQPPATPDAGGSTEPAAAAGAPGPGHDPNKNDTASDTPGAQGEEKVTPPAQVEGAVDAVTQGTDAPEHQPAEPAEPTEPPAAGPAPVAAADEPSAPVNNDEAVDTHTLDLF